MHTVKEVDKYMSIITNFGCHYTCPYCIVKNNNLKIPKTTLRGLCELNAEIKNNNCNIISISGGGDPLYEYEKHKDYYGKLFEIATLPLELHTSYIKSTFPIAKMKRVVYHIRSIDSLYNIQRKGSEIIRVVLVATKELTKRDILKISKFVELSKIIDELSFRQMVNGEYGIEYFNHNLLVRGHNIGLWHYIKQNDYNLYFVNGKVYRKFSEIGKV